MILTRKIVRKIVLAILRGSKIKPGDRIYIEAVEVGKMITDLLVEEIAKLDAVAYVEKRTDRTDLAYSIFASEETARLYYEMLAETKIQQMWMYNKHLILAGSSRRNKYGNLPPHLDKYRKAMLKKVYGALRDTIEWWGFYIIPTSKKFFEDIEGVSVEACHKMAVQAFTADYTAMAKAAEGLLELLSIGKGIKIKTVDPEGNEYLFKCSIQGQKPVIDDGSINLPGGEVYLAPIRNSAEGHLFLEPISIVNDMVFSGILLSFSEGKIEEESCRVGDEDALRSILDEHIDNRYLGEVAIAFNFLIQLIIGNIVFDEKFGGSFHIAPGKCAPGTENGQTTTTLHWDIIGFAAEFWVDDVLVVKDGKFQGEYAVLNQLFI